jgi:hypothetical protein
MRIRRKSRQDLRSSDLRRNSVSSNSLPELGSHDSMRRNSVSSNSLPELGSHDSMPKLAPKPMHVQPPVRHGSMPSLDAAKAASTANSKTSALSFFGFGSK